jgi:hypothetical protein
MSCYCDSSFFFRQLLPSSTRISAIDQAAAITREYGFVPLSSFTKFEVIQALQFEAWRSRNDRTKGIPLAQVDAAINMFAAEVGLAYRIVQIEWDPVFARAELLTRATPEEGWRTLDLIHVAAAIVSGVTVFYSDQEQNRLASREGLQTPLLTVSK